MWSEGIEADIRLPSRFAALQRFQCLPEEAKEAAPISWRNYIRCRKAQGRADEVFLMPFLDPDMIWEWLDPPPMDMNGKFKISPESGKEWAAWLNHFKEKAGGEKMVEHYTKLGRVVTADRWPPGHSTANGSKEVAA